MKRDFSQKRETKNLTPEKLYDILRKINPKDMADETYTRLTGMEPPKEEKQ